MFVLFREKAKISPGLISRYFKTIKNKLVQPETADINQQLIIKLNKKKLPTWNQLKQLPKFLNRIEKLELIIALIIFLAATSSLTWRFYVKKSNSGPAYGGTYTEGLVGSPHLVNPILASTDVDRDLVRLLFSGLMKFDDDGNIVPDLASGYTVDPTQTTYTFELRDDLRWHDDNPITADDIIFTINSIKNGEYGSPFKNSLSGISVYRISDKIVQFKMDRPFSAFLSIMTIGIIPEHLWYSVPAFSANLADLNIKPIGSGPYEFKSLTRDSSGTIKSYALKSYHDYHLGRPYIDEINFKFYPDFETVVSALKNKNIEGLIYLPKEYKDQIKDKDIALHNLQFPQYTGVFFNPRDNELLADGGFRQALAISVDKERILSEVLNGDGQIIATPILPGIVGYNPDLKAEPLDPAKASQILDKLGWTKAEGDTFRSKKSGDEKKELTIKLTTVDQAENTKIVNIIKENWQAIGIKTDLEIVSKDKIKQDVIEPRNYQALVYGEVINTNSGPYPFWHSSQYQNPGLNLSVLGNKDVDSYLEAAKNAKDNADKIEPLKKFQEKLLSLNFAILLYNPTYTYPTTSKLKGLEKLQFINLPADRFNNINSWYIKTKRVLSNH